MEMFNQGSFLQLIGMVVIFVVMGILISKIGGGVPVKTATDKDVHSGVSAAGKAGDGVIAAITAAVNEYRKNN